MVERSTPPDPSSGKRVAFVGYDLDRDGGEARELMNLARGLKSLGFDPVAYSLYASADVRSEYARLSLELRTVQAALSRRDRWGMMTYDPRLASRLGRLIRSAPPCEVYIVAQDAALPMVREELPGRKVYQSNGDLSLLLLDPGFRQRHGLAGWWLSRGFVPSVQRHSELAREFDAVTANSEFTKAVISFLYDCAVDGVVYPPVDVAHFAPGTNARATPLYALTLLKSTAEPAFRTACALASRTRLHVVGRAAVPGAENLGRVDDARLVEEYRQAGLTVSASFREFYGYPIGESLACGTPVLAYDQGGAHEILQDGGNG